MDKKRSETIDLRKIKSKIIDFLDPWYGVVCKVSKNGFVFEESEDKPVTIEDIQYMFGAIPNILGIVNDEIYKYEISYTRKDCNGVFRDRFMIKEIPELMDDYY